LPVGALYPTDTVRVEFASAPAAGVRTVGFSDGVNTPVPLAGIETLSAVALLKPFRLATERRVVVEDPCFIPSEV